MTDWHPEERLLGLFMRGELEGDESRDIVIHLLSGCENCRRIARQEFPCESLSTGGTGKIVDQWDVSRQEGYDHILENVLPAVREAESQLERQRRAASILLNELKQHPHQRRLLLLRNSPKYRNSCLVELLLEEARIVGSKKPRGAVQLAELALEIACHLEDSVLSDDLLHDLRARAHAVLGNAWRVAGDLPLASENFALAESCLANGTGDEVLRARVAELKSHLVGLQRDYDAAFGLLNVAISVYQRVGDRHRMGRALISKAFHLSEKGDLVQAIGSLKQGIKYIDTSRDPRLELVAKHNLLSHLYETGRYHQAIALIPETRSLHERLGSEVDLVRFHWLVGQILLESGEVERAESQLLEVREFFLKEEIAHDSALVSLDLATIYLKQGRTTQLKALAAEMLSVFHALRISREAIAALVLFQKAVEMERVSFNLVRDLTAYLKNSRFESNLPFRPSSGQ